MKIKVNIIVFGKFHAFDLASFLHKKGYLKNLITSFPAYKVHEVDSQLPKTKIRSFFILEIFSRGLKKLNLSSQKIDDYIKLIFQKMSLNFISEKDINIIWAGNGFHLLKKITNNINIIERHSIHVKNQNKLLIEELNNFNKSYSFNIENINSQLLEYDLANYIVTPSNYVKKSFFSYQKNYHKTYVNPLGCDLDKFKKVEKKDKKFRIISCGIASYRKGIQYLLKAFIELEKQLDIEWWHLGGVTNEINELIIKTNSKNIHLKGNINKFDLFKFYSQGSVFVLPSIEDGFGMVILEAMACGLPVICSENTGIKDILTSSGAEGYIIPIRNSESIKEKIKFLYENENIRDEMSKRALQHVNENFSWNNYGDRYSKFLDTIAN